MPTSSTASESSPESLTELLDQLQAASQDKRCLSLAEVINAVGRRSFAPILLVAGLALQRFWDFWVAAVSG